MVVKGYCAADVSDLSRVCDSDDEGFYGVVVTVLCRQ